MSKLIVLTAVLAVSFGAFAQPVAAPKAHPVTTHGDTRDDPYFWLRDKNDPAVLAHLEAENAHTAAVMKGTEALQQKLYDELIGHIKETDLDLPIFRAGYYSYIRTEAGKQYPIYARRKGSMDAPEEVVLDVNALAQGHEFADVGDRNISDDGNLLAYTLDTTAAAQYTLFVKDLRTGAILPDRIEHVSETVWAPDHKTLFYVTYDPKTLRSADLYRHVLGAPKDELLYHEPDELYGLSLSRTRDKTFLLLESRSKTTSETRALRLSEAGAALRVIAPRRDGHTYIVEHRGDRFYIRTNDRAPNYRLVTVEDSNPAMDRWKEVIPHRAEVELFEVNLFEKHMAVSEVTGGNRTIRIVDFKSGASHPITFGEPVYNLSRDANPEFTTTKFRYRYNSLLRPEAIYEYDVVRRTNTLLKQSEAPHYDPSLYAAEQVFAVAPDGAKVPVSIVYKKPLTRDGKRPMLINGYGAYGQPLWPFFVRYQLPLLDRGVIYAVAHVRGGGGMGQPWREAGRMLSKRNTFTDFIAAAEHLVQKKYTSSDRLGITGRSAGGLLIGAATNLRPDLFKAAVMTSPFVDVLNTMLDPSLPLTTAEYIEWGNPNVPKEYEYIKTYSPYDNVRAAAYPAMLVQVSLNDRQVGFWEGTKFVARVRERKTDDRPVLLKVNMGGGHGGSSGRYDATREYAFELAFVLWQLGVSP
ncbi:MAG TPA: S9 family peptidase [Thermoanaerobaculia bacterium]